MDYKEKIYEYLNSTKNFRDRNYEYLESLYGDKMVKEVLLEIFRSDEVDIYTKIKGKGKNHMISNNVLIVITSELVKSINDILISLGYDDKNFLKKMLEDKINIVLIECRDVDAITKINELYKKFVYFRNMICECNLNLIRGAIKGIDNRYMYEELYQEGFMSLMMAIEKFDSTKGTKFSTYAFMRIDYAIKEHKYDYEFSVTLSRSIMSVYQKMLRLQEDNEELLDKKEMASRLGITERTLLKYLDINNFLDNDKEYESELLEQTASLDVHDRVVENQVIYGNLEDVINELLEEFSDNDKLLLRYRFFGDKIRTFNEVADLMGVSRRVVSYRCNGILRMMKKRGSDLRRFY